MLKKILKCILTVLVLLTTMSFTNTNNGNDKNLSVSLIKIAGETNEF